MDPSQPLQILPENINEFLSNAVKIPPKYVQGCWTTFVYTIWQQDANRDSRGEDANLFRWYVLQGLLFAASGLYWYKHVTATWMLFPPTHVCVNTDCMKHGSMLCRKYKPCKVVLFMLAEGACPTYSVHLFCHGMLGLLESIHPDLSPGCNTNYHHDYTVKDDVRTYYTGVLDVVHFGDHQFVERKVLNLFIGLMLSSW